LVAWLLVMVRDSEAYLEMADTESVHWWFAARRDILEHVIGQFGLPATARILEAGSGTGGNLAMLSAHGIVSAIEMDKTACRIAKEKVGGRVDLRRGHFPDDIPFEGETFDLIAMFDVLEHVEQDVETLEALRSLLAPSGRILITSAGVPVDVECARCLSAAQAALHREESSQGVGGCGTAGGAGVVLQYVAAAVGDAGALEGSAAAGRAIIRHDRSPCLRTLFSIFRSERRLLDWFDLPAGVSLLAVVRRGDGNISAA
jgi:SAM-dependent methyltransferase